MAKPRQTDAFPAAQTLTRRVTFSIPVKLADNINRLASRMKVSQSSLLAELMTEPVEAMVEIIDLIPQVGATTDDVKRARGKSAALIRDVVQQAQTLVGDLDHDSDR